MAAHNTANREGTTLAHLAVSVKGEQHGYTDKAGGFRLILERPFLYNSAHRERDAYDRFPSQPSSIGNYFNYQHGHCELCPRRIAAALAAAILVHFTCSSGRQYHGLYPKSGRADAWRMGIIWYLIKKSGGRYTGANEVGVP